MIDLDGCSWFFLRRFALKTFNGGSISGDTSDLPAKFNGWNVRAFTVTMLDI